LTYPSLPIFATSSQAHHARLLSLGATALFDYRSPSVALDIKAASPESRGVDLIIDCVASGATQLDICDTLDPAGLVKYGLVETGVDVPVPEGVNKIVCGGWALMSMPGGEVVIPALTELIEEGKYQVPLPVKVVGRGLEQVNEGLEKLKSGVSGTKLVVTL
jgi:NADPH:quinone reductase-like Zn-dependent oxidoreductase